MLQDRKILKVSARPANLVARKSQPIPLAVCSHERSGTHFTMNSIAGCSEYVSKPWINFDIDPLGGLINFASQQSVAKFIKNMASLKFKGSRYGAASIIKGHYPAWVFEQAVKGRLNVIYVHRNPVDVFLSYWNFLNAINTVQFEGPSLDSPDALCQAKPAGRSMRYQLDTFDTYFDRWANHVTGWTRLAAQAKNVYAVQYEDLFENHSQEVEKICTSLGIKMKRKVRRPDPTKNVIKRFREK